MPAREALIVASARYSDPLLRQLQAPEADAIGLGEVLSNPDIGGFQAQTLIDRPSYEVAAAIEEFFIDRHPDDLLLLYFSGHGIKDADGRLFFATTNTKRSLLLATSVPASMVNDAMLRSRSRRQVLILDCCHSGAFARGMVAKSDDSVGTIDHFQGTGRIVLTASDATQYAMEAEQITGSGVRSIFTEVIVDGLRTGAPDTDYDGRISLDDLFAYTEERVLERTPTQRPMKWVLGATGALIIAQNKNPVIHPAELPANLIQALDKESLPAFRQFAARELGKILHGHDRALVLAAELKLKELLEDDSRAIEEIARGSLGDKALREEVERGSQAITERKLQAEEERQEQIAAEEARRAKEAQEQKAAAETARRAEEERQDQIAAEEARREREVRDRKSAAESARLAEDERQRNASLEKARHEQGAQKRESAAQETRTVETERLHEAEEYEGEKVERGVPLWLKVAAASVLLVVASGALLILLTRPSKPLQDASFDTTPTAQTQQAGPSLGANVTPNPSIPAGGSGQAESGAKAQVPESTDQKPDLANQSKPGQVKHPNKPFGAMNNQINAPAKQYTEMTPKKVRISAGIAQGMLLQKSPPIYPPIARAARVSGTVALLVVISKTGSIKELRVASGPAMLQQAALDAVETWRYKPYLLNGEPVEVETTINVVFVLDDQPKPKFPPLANGNPAAAKE